VAPALREVSFGMMMLALGMIGMLKSAVEMAEFHLKKAAASRLLGSKEAR
jgi:hypothetical protein